MQVELHRRAAPAVVVAVREEGPHQVLGPGHGGERVAVPLAGREAPQRSIISHKQALEVGGYPVVLAGVGVWFVRDVDDAEVPVRVSAVVGFHAAVDAQEICTHDSSIPRWRGHMVDEVEARLSVTFLTDDDRGNQQ